MYILIDYQRFGKNKTMSYENFKDLKDSAINKLDGRGWYDKNKIDLRSLKSCIDYLTSDFNNVSFKKSRSYKKFYEYRFGDNAMSL